ncbi:MAG: hypothetical protein MK212_07530 [Saprospiraceae bacterium]|nr:hypothetical protein [Saprospiraceae bacterium]
MSFRRKAKVDKNQAQIVEALRKVGAVVKHVHQLKNLFDVLVFYRGNTYCVEIKSSRKSKLTEGELECKQELESVGVAYWVIYSVDDAMKMLKIR